MSQFWLPALFGLGTGILSAWGVGGGTLLLLCMTLILGVDQSTAQAINLLCFLPTAGVSLLFHGRKGYLDKGTWRTTVISGLPTALLGALAAQWLEPDLFRIPFGLFLLYAGVSLLRSTGKT